MSGRGRQCRLWIILVLLSLFSCLVTDARITSLTSTINGERTTETLEGCVVELMCSGEGDTVVWRIFGSRDPIVTNANIQVLTPLVPTSGTVTGRLFFRPIASSNTGAYTCTIGQNTRTIRISVKAAVTLVPGNTEYDISDHDVGKTLPVLCNVEACVTNIDVAVRRDTTVLESVLVANAAQDPQFNLLVSEDLPGEHHCHATYIVNGQTRTVSSVPFNITGTPMVPAPTTKNSNNGAPSMASPFFSFLLFSVTIFLALLH